MNYLPLDPTQTVVLFADLQTGIIERSSTVPLAALRKSVSALAKLAHLFDMPAIVTAAPGNSAPQITPEIGAALGSIAPIVRSTTDSFLDVPTRDAIVATKRKTLLIAGVATEIIVQHTALSGLAHGFHVQLVIDACGGIGARSEDAALRRLVQAGAVTTSIASLAGQLAGDFSQPKAGQAIGILYEMATN